MNRAELRRELRRHGFRGRKSRRGVPYEEAAATLQAEQDEKTQREQRVAERRRGASRRAA